MLQILSQRLLMLADETVYKEWEDRMERDATTASSLEAEQHIQAYTRFEAASKQSNDPPLLRVNTLGSGEDIMKLKELMVEGSTVLVESHHIPLGAPTTSQPPLSAPSRIPTRQETKVPQPSSPTYTNVAYEVAFTSVDVVHGGDATTVSNINAGHGSGNIPKSPTMPHDSPLPRGHTPGSDEGKLKQTKQTYGAALTKLIKKVKKLEQTVKTSQARRRAKIVVSDDEESSEDTSKQGRMIEDIDQDARISLVTPTKVSSQEDQSEDQLGVLSAAKVLADAAKKNVNTYTRRRRAVSTGSEGVSTASRIFSTGEESVSTAGASMPISTAGKVQQVNIIIPSSSETTKDKGKAIMQESEQPKKINKRVQIQMSLDEELAQKLHEEEQARFNAEQEAKFNVEQEELLASETTKDKANPPVANIDWDNVTSFVPMDSVMEKERTKRAGLNLQEESSKWKKTGEGSEPTEELKADEISQEDLQQMIMVVLEYMHDPLVWKLYDICGVHHVSSVRGHDIFMLVEKDYPLTRGLLTLMLANKLQVDKYSEMANELLRKIFILANRPRK
ncbi:hypothetical protein Tco_0689758 [Tanacetum coccineum]